MKNTFPRNTNQQQFITHLKQILKDREEELNRHQIADEIEKKEYGAVSRKTAKAYLSTYRGQIEKDAELETREESDGTPGDPTVYWRLTQ